MRTPFGSLLLLLLALSAAGRGLASPTIEPGVSLELAKHRAGIVSHINYRLRFNIPAGRRGMMGGMAGRESVTAALELAFSRRTREEFYGIGASSDEDDRSAFGRPSGARRAPAARLRRSGCVESRFSPESLVAVLLAGEILHSTPPVRPPPRWAWSRSRLPRRRPRR